jgi:lysophospholipase L1-like esterase
MNRSTRALSWHRKLIWGLLVSGVIVSLPEALLRLCLFEVPVPPPATLCAWPSADAQMTDLGYFLRPDMTCFYDLRPGARYSYEDGPADVINESGMRGPNIPRGAKNAVRIACFGDSSTFGMCVSEELTWVRQLEGLLREARQRRNLETINAGVIGYTVYQGRAKYHARVRTLKPDVALLAFGAINEQLPAMGASDVARGATWGHEYYRHVHGIADRVWALRTVQLVGQKALEARQRERTALMAAWHRAYGEFEAGRPYQSRMSYDEFRTCLTQFIDDLRHDKCLPILVNPHRRESTEKRYPQVLPLSEVILDVARSSDVLLLDCNELFKQNPNYETEYFADTHHPNECGNRVIAAAAAEFLLPIVGALP